jgi:hypothetical protein
VTKLFSKKLLLLQKSVVFFQAEMLASVQFLKQTSCVTWFTHYPLPNLKAQSS